MMCGKCGKSAGLCPLSFGLAVGVTCFFAMLIWSLWVLQYGLTPMMAGHTMVPQTLSAAFVHALWGLLKGFLFGFFVALFYDLMLKCKKCGCWKSNGECMTCGSPHNNNPTPRL